MKVVWKHTFGHEQKLRKPFTVELPTGASIIRVGVNPDDGAASFWFECNPGARKQKRIFKVVWTGDELPDAATHRGMWWEAQLVFHLYELPRDENYHHG